MISFLVRTLQIDTNRIVLFLLFFSALISVGANAEQTNKSYKFGVFPYLTPVRLHTIYAPITSEISEKLNARLQFRTASNFNQFLQEIRSQAFDFALIQPFWYPIAVDELGYLPLAQMNEPFVARIVVLEDSEIRDLEDLKGQVVATPPSFVPVVHLARIALNENAINPEKDIVLKAFKNIDSCYQQLLIGSAQACISPPFAQGVWRNMFITYKSNSFSDDEKTTI